MTLFCLLVYKIIRADGKQFIRTPTSPPHADFPVLYAGILHLFNDIMALDGWPEMACTVQE